MFIFLQVQLQMLNHSKNEVLWYEGIPLKIINAYFRYESVLNPGKG